jgi:hypothetical protein
VLVVECIVAPDGVAVAPCGTINGVAYSPLVTDVTGSALDYSGIAGLFSWAVSFVLIVFVVGYTVGAIVRVIKSA